MLLECNDVMLEEINSNLDEISGIKKVPEAVLVESEFKSPEIDKARLSGSWNTRDKIASMHKSAKLLTAKNIVRPQVHFKTPVDNSNSPFEPRIKIKPHSIKPLAVLAEYDDEGNVESFLHPYEFELNKFVVPAEQLVKAEVEKPKKTEETVLGFIDTEEKLKKMLEELRNVKELAVDLEHHSYRTFQGITCLMQISTRSKDFIIDTIELRDELYVLNEIFTDPKVVKVFHGSNSDVEWLQRDLSLYIVNMFDTHQAAKRLNFARLSLSYLLKHYCNIDADKTFQMADWRIRPLPEELIFYAREDTHYLLYIYDQLRNELLKQGNGEPHLLNSVYQASTEICMKRFVKQRLLEDSHLDLYRRSKKVFDNRQMFALKELFAWRDCVGRLEDESCGYILPNHMLMHISENLPRELQGILACCNPVPPLVRQHLHHLHQIILKARDQPLIRKIVPDVSQRTSVVSSVSLNQFLYCPHDLTYEEDFRDNLPTLLGSNGLKIPEDSPLKATNSHLSVFDQASDDEDSSTPQLTKLKDIKFITPYSRYLSILPIAEEQERLANLKEAEKAKSRQLCPVKVESEPVKRKSEEAPPAADQPQVKKVKTEPVQSFREMLESQKKEINEQNPNGQMSRRKQKSMQRKQKWEQQNQSKELAKQEANFDYSQVDYTKFEGGSRSQQNQRGRGGGRKQFDSKFRGRGGQKAKTADKQFNKMFSFSKLNNTK